jgi:hypothetical protein
MNNDWKPKPQTPDQVDEGLRNAFRQAKKDGVMDATPYLKQMTFKSDIEKTEAEIKVLQKKLDLLKEIETHKSQKLWNILSNKYDYISATCDDIVSAVEEWLPKPQSAAGSQNVDTELLVDGFNHCLEKIKGMLR